MNAFLWIGDHRRISARVVPAHGGERGGHLVEIAIAAPGGAAGLKVLATAHASEAQLRGLIELLVSVRDELRAKGGRR